MLHLLFDRAFVSLCPFRRRGLLKDGVGFTEEGLLLL